MWSQYGVPVGPKSKPKIFDSAVALFTERLFYSESLLVSALIKITFLVENPSRPERRELLIAGKAYYGKKFVIITHVPQASQAKKLYKGCDHKLHFPSNLGLLMWVGLK